MNDHGMVACVSCWACSLRVAEGRRVRVDRAGHGTCRGADLWRMHACELGDLVACCIGEENPGGREKPEA